MISIDQSNLRFISDYFQNTKQQLQNLQSDLSLVANDQWPQINLKMLTDVLSSCQKSVSISLLLCRRCEQLAQDKHFLQSQVRKIRSEMQMLIEQNRDLSDSVETLQLNKRQNIALFSQLQKEISSKLQQTVQIDFLEEFDRKDPIYKLQLQHYESQLKQRDQKSKQMSQQLSNAKKQLSLKIVQLQLADLALQDLWEQKNQRQFKQSKTGSAYSPSLDLSSDESEFTKSDQRIKKCSLMQDLAQSQIILPLVPFSSHLNKSDETIPEILQQTPITTENYGILYYQSKIFLPSAFRANEAINFICSEIMKNGVTNYGIQTEEALQLREYMTGFEQKQ